MGKKSYSDKLKDPRWQKKRLEIMQLRGFKCEKCGSEDKELHVHHRCYINGREVWEYDNDIFQLLCHDCHQKEHDKKNKIQEVRVEVIPDKYKEIIELISEGEKNDSDYISDLVTIMTLLSHDKNDESVLNVFAYALNNICEYDKIIAEVKQFHDMDEFKMEIEMKLANIEKHLSNLKK